MHQGKNYIKFRSAIWPIFVRVRETQNDDPVRA